tara:strand:- start:138 stop:1841 length:1704 start_codon:yes stop_codon:yes gene_type:complete
MILISNPNLIDEVLELRLKDSNEKIYAFGDWTDDPKFIEKLIKNNISVISIHSSKNSTLDMKKYESIYNKELLKFTEKLSSVNNNKVGKRNWEILVGPYLRTIIFTIMSRERLVKDLNLNKKATFYSSKFDLSEHIPFDFQNYVSLSYSHDWNSLIYAIIFSKLGHDVFFIDQVKKDKINYEYRKNNFLFDKIFGIIAFFNFKKNLIIDIGLNSILEKIIKILSLNFFYLSLNQKRNNFEFERNNKISLVFYENNKNTLTSLFDICYIFLPYLYIENYQKSLKKKNDGLNIKNFFSATSHFVSDEFKLWLSKNFDEKKSKIYAIQHGGAFGFTRFHSHIESVENSISDKRLTWGWVNKDNNKIKKFISFKLLFRFNFQISQRKNIILFCTRRKLYERGEAWDSPHWNNEYTKKLIFITKYLKELKNFNIKIHPQQNKYGINLKKIINLNSKFNNFIETKNSNKLIISSKLNICTNNSTVFLESIKLNIPTILIFWDYKINPLYKERFADVRKLIKANIIFLNTHDAVQFIQKISSNVDAWWNKDFVQKIRKEFIKNYVNTDIFQILK